MPEMDGFSLLKSVRAKMPNLPIIFLSSKAEEQDQIIGFTLGADDYITKPFSKHLLLFRVAAVLRRHTVGTGVIWMRGCAAGRSPLTKIGIW